MVAALKSGEKALGLKGFWTAWLTFRKASIAAGKEDSMSIATIYTVAGNKDESLIWLEKAYNERRPDSIHRSGSRL